ncbi:hypothetical protein SAMN05660226_03998 [Parapedobacter luteus]|uniref:Uncharacterized protein n=1 Tax=Parapedobacter luteus TaxID=623280 RepID=A0A1T5FIB5_9SPHI|nr:hypothetical protein SAMN05660226_03998 [Parapedobacter luteus]
MNFVTLIIFLRSGHLAGANDSISIETYKINYYEQQQHQS